MNPRAFHQPFYPLLALSLITLAACLVAFQPPPATGTGSGSVTVQVSTTSDTPLAGVTVRYLDEWQRQPYATCTTDLTGECLLTLSDVPALGEMVRGVVEIGGQLHDAMFLDGEHIRVKVTLDERGEMERGADVLATRDPSLTPTLISVEDALATLTAAAVEPLATPSPEVVLTIAEAYARMTATAVAHASPTPSPRLSPTPRATPRVGVAVVVNNTPAPLATLPATALASATVETSRFGVQVAATGVVLVMVGVVLWRSLRRRAGGGA